MVVVEKFLLKVLELQFPDITAKCTISELNCLFGATCIVLRVDGLNANNYGVVVILVLKQIFSLELPRIQHAYLRWKTLV